MRTRLVSLGLLGALAAAVLGGSAGAAPAGWGRAIEAPGTASLNTDGYAQVTSVSCAAASVCVAGGWYKDASGYVKPFVVSEKHGHWGHAIEVPGMVSLNFGDGEVTSVSCGAAGACAAGGWYTDVSDHSQAFVVSERHGRWGDAVEAPGVAALGNGDYALVTSVSCGGPGACAAGGNYEGVSGHNQAFVIVETHGSWGDAIRVRGTVRLNRGPDAMVDSVSCGAAGACVAGGHYTDRSGDYQAFVERLTNGHWGWAVEVPGTAALNHTDAEVSTVSCAGAGACAAGGYYTSASGYSRAFVVSETQGRWGQAVEVPRTVALSSGSAQVTSVSCAAGGVCVAGGYYTDISLDEQAFVVSSKHGRWGRAVVVPGSGNAELRSVSCGAAGACVAGGRYIDPLGHFQAFVISETHGHWGHAIKVPGTAALNRGDAQVNAISCAAAGMCAAGGTYQDASSGYQAFVVTRP